MYLLLRSFLFLLPPEQAHLWAMHGLRMARMIGGRKWIAHLFTPPDPGKEKVVWGLLFRNPVGLGAGFDKNAHYLSELDALGFGFVEIGTVTPLAQQGNPLPRLFRLKKDAALINRMGFNNEGVENVARHVIDFRKKYPGTTLIIGGNIGKNKSTPNEEAAGDYATCFERLAPLVDYMVINVSSPNTPGLRQLQEKGQLEKIVRRLQLLNEGLERPVPLLLKIAPDLTLPQVDNLLSLARETGLDGLIISNTTIDRTGLRTSEQRIDQIGAGGLSGKPLMEKSTALLEYVCQKAPGLPVIASGGIFTATDAQQKFDAGAALVQVWTGFIYKGPGILKKISAGIHAGNLKKTI